MNLRADRVQNLGRRKMFKYLKESSWEVWFIGLNSFTALF